MTPPKPKQRRADDPRINQLQADVKHLHADLEEAKSVAQENARLLAENTQVTKDIRDILGTFKVVGALAKWLTIVGGFFVGVYHGWQSITGR